MYDFENYNIFFTSFCILRRYCRYCVEFYIINYILVIIFKCIEIYLALYQ